MAQQALSGLSPNFYLRKKEETGNILYHLSRAYSTSNSELRSRPPNLNCQEGELIGNIIKQGLKRSAVNKSDYILQKSTNLHKYLAHSTLNEIVIDDNNDDQLERQKQSESDEDSWPSLEP